MRNSRMFCVVFSIALVYAAIVGCSKSSSTSSGTMSEPVATSEGNEMEGEITAALAELPQDDRVMAAAQKYCAVETANRLGSMGAPFKLMVDGQPVFLCCEGCKDAALKDPQTTLASVAKLKESHPSPQ